MVQGMQCSNAQKRISRLSPGNLRNARTPHERTANCSHSGDTELPPSLSSRIIGGPPHRNSKCPSSKIPPLSLRMLHFLARSSSRPLRTTCTIRTGRRARWLGCAEKVLVTVGVDQWTNLDLIPGGPDDPIPRPGLHRNCTSIQSVCGIILGN
jgi:hypothetical protein